MDQLRFTIPEMLSLIGLAQCIYLLVYMAFRAGHIRAVVLPFLYFFVLGLAFFLAFAQGYVGDAVPFYFLGEWAAWFLGPPLSALLVMQILPAANKIPGMLVEGWNIGWDGDWFATGWGSCMAKLRASIRKPSTPRSSQKRATSSTAS